jgi:ectoine hydroxylase-related dioxygenase (phytanoyl-CoA dioxygenase family)
MNSLQQQFDDEGYVVIRNLLTPTEVADYKAKLQKLSGLSDSDFNKKQARANAWAMPDGVTRLREWWPLIFNKRLVSSVREILGPTARYTQHSDLHVHRDAVGWHRDSADRQFGVGPDWDESQEKYRVARVAIYLQSYKQSGSSLGVIPKSHRKQFRIALYESALHDKLKKVLKKSDLLFPFLTVRPVWIKNNPGDCVIFNQRILHSGSHIRGPKYAIFLSYGVENEHSRNHRRYYLYERPDAKYEDFHPDLVRQLKDANLYLDAKKPSEILVPA